MSTIAGPFDVLDVPARSLLRAYFTARPRGDDDEPRGAGDLKIEERTAYRPLSLDYRDQVRDIFRARTVRRLEYYAVQAVLGAHSLVDLRGLSSDYYDDQTLRAGMATWKRLDRGWQRAVQVYDAGYRDEHDEVHHYLPDGVVFGLAGTPIGTYVCLAGPAFGVLGAPGTTFLSMASTWRLELRDPLVGTLP